MHDNNYKKMIYGALCAALAAAISLTISYSLPTTNTFNFPFFAIPLIIYSLLFGAKMGLMVAFIADLFIGFLGKYGYDPLFVFHTLAWGFIPGLFVQKQKPITFIKLILIVFFSYLAASLCNSLAIWVRFGKPLFRLTLLIRSINVLLLTPPLTLICFLILKRLNIGVVFINNLGYYAYDKIKQE